MQWEAITAIATSLTVLAAIGAPMVMSVLNKPKVFLTSPEPKAEWYYLYRKDNDKEVIDRVEIFVTLNLKNNGQEGTNVEGVFETKRFGVDIMFRSTNMIRLLGEGVRIEEACMHLHSFPQNVILQKGETLHGTLKLKPWGNRKLLIFGKKYITSELTVTENQAKRYTLAWR